MNALQRTQHVKVWLSMAQFELSSGKTEAASISTAAEPEQQPSADAESGGASSEAMQAAIQRARAIYREANDYLRKRCRQAEPDAVRVAQEERIVLLEAWRTFEVPYTATAILLLNLLVLQIQQNKQV